MAWLSGLFVCLIDSLSGKNGFCFSFDFFFVLFWIVLGFMVGLREEGGNLKREVERAMNGVDGGLNGMLDPGRFLSRGAER